MSGPLPPPRWCMLVEAAAARWLEVPQATLKRWRRAGVGPRYIQTGRLVRYRRVDLDAWLTEPSKQAPGGPEVAP